MQLGITVTDTATGQSGCAQVPQTPVVHVCLLCFCNQRLNCPKDRGFGSSQAANGCAYAQVAAPAKQLRGMRAYDTVSNQRMCARLLVMQHCPVTAELAHLVACMRVMEQDTCTS